MGIVGDDEGRRPECKSTALRKTAERQRLAEALRANLSRRKAQSRDRHAREASQSNFIQNDTGPSDAAAKQD